MGVGVVLNTANSTSQGGRSQEPDGPLCGAAALDGVGGPAHSPRSPEGQTQNSCPRWVQRGRGLSFPDGAHTRPTRRGPAQRQRGPAAHAALTSRLLLLRSPRRQDSEAHGGQTAGHLPGLRAVPSHTLDPGGRLLGESGVETAVSRAPTSSQLLSCFAL